MVVQKLVLHQLTTETAETIIQQSVLQELGKQKVKLSIILEEEKTDSSKVKSSVNRKSKFIYRGFKENDKKMKKVMCDNVNDEKKNFKNRAQQK